MARGITASGTTGTVTASGGTLGVHITGLPNFLDILKVKIQPSGGAGPFDVEVFQKDTLGSTDLMGKWQDVGGNIYDPMDISGGTPAEGNPAEAIIAYEDADASGELHLKFTNNDSSNRTYDYQVVYEERWKFDASRVATAQKAELLGDVLYFGGRTTSQAMVKRNGTSIEIRLGDDSGYTSLAAHFLTSYGSAVYLGGFTSGDVVLTKSGAGLIVGLADNSADASLRASTLEASADNVFLGGTGAGHVRLKRSSASLEVRLGDDSAYAPFTAETVAAADWLAAFGDIVFFGGAAASNVSLRRNTTTLRVRLGNDSGYADLECRDLSADSVTCGTLTTTTFNYTFGGFTGSHFGGTYADGILMSVP